jgi:hypothetical protein
MNTYGKFNGKCLKVYKILVKFQRPKKYSSLLLPTTQLYSATIITFHTSFTLNFLFNYYA